MHLALDERVLLYEYPSAMDFVFFIYILALLFSLFLAGVLLGVAFSKPFREAIIERLRHHLRLGRAVCNPIIAPGAHPWNAEAVLNPAAGIIGGRTHLLFRAIGMDGVSRLGYASSPDGFIFDELLPYPAYVSTNPRNLPGQYRRYSPVLYPSGGSWGGCEDPRMVTIDGTVYVTYNAFDGWDFMRIAFISISENDFLTKQFGKWRQAQLISPPGQRHKNWVLFPEKIHGKFAILHSINPKPDVAYVDDLTAVGTTAPFIKSFEGHRGDMENGNSGWDYIVRSAGPPPIKTDRGWLVLYHGHEKNETHRYKLGAMLLDLNDPTHVIARAVTPILEPEAVYENEGKPGVVYAAGATVQDGTLRVYYGGADKVVCVASAPLEPLVDSIIEGHEAALTPAPLEVR